MVDAAKKKTAQRISRSLTLIFCHMYIKTTFFTSVHNLHKIKNFWFLYNSRY